MRRRGKHFAGRSRLRFSRAVLPALALSGAPALAGPYAPAGGKAGSNAVSASSPSIVEWAVGATIIRGVRDVENPTAYDPDPASPLNHAYFGGSDGASEAANTASLADGGSAITPSDNTAPIGMPAQPQSAYDAVALGQNGSATLTFSQPLIDGPGPDFAVFGNGFTSGLQSWVKPALVEVSSDGIHFFQFPSVSLTPLTTQVGSYSELDPTNLYDIAGKDPAGWGTAFDLSELATVSPLLNVNHVTEVRILGVSGDTNPAYATYDSAGHIINSPYPAASAAGSEGFCLAGVGVLNEAVASGYTALTWSNATGSGMWAGDSNWNPAGTLYADGDAVNFDNTIVTANQTVTLNSTVSPAAVTVNNIAGNYTIAGTGGITGITGLVKFGSKSLKLATANTYSGITIVNGGTLELAASGALPSGTVLTIADGAQVLADTNTGLLQVASLNLDPAGTGSAQGRFDLTNNGLVVHYGNLTTLTAAVKSGANNLSWNGNTGITSSTAAADPTHLTALGIIQNTTAAGAALYTSSFDGANGLSLATTDVLVMYTYYGDANLDGHVDGSDYSLIDNAVLMGLTGWQNGDFNYDGIINGSDYTLIDNAFNAQGAAIEDSLANPSAAVTTQIEGNQSVPEPVGFMGLLVPGVLLGRRRRSTVGSERLGRSRGGFTLVELLVVIGIIAVLIGILLPSLSRARQQAMQVQCASNIHQLALANLLYAADNHTYCVPAAVDIFDDLGDGEGGHYRWHGWRAAANQPFNPALGPLASYLGTSGRVKSCPVFDASAGVITGNNFEQGCGGYGYNESYIGGRSDVYGYSSEASATSAKMPQILRPAETVMFTDAGIAQPARSAVVVTEYSFCEPPWIQENPGVPSTDQAWPSIHFRHRGRANVAWADGHVTAESLTFSNTSYGLSTQQVQHAQVGWFGQNRNTLFQIIK